MRDRQKKISAKIGVGEVAKTLRWHDKKLESARQTSFGNVLPHSTTIALGQFQQLYVTFLHLNIYAYPTSHQCGLSHFLIFWRLFGLKIVLRAGLE